MTAPPEPPPDRRERLLFEGLAYARYTDDARGVRRGTVELDEGEGSPRRVPGFPPIERVYRLGVGARRAFGEGRFAVEEKLDGYNVRVLQHEGRLLAFTRGGFVCPFTTEWAEHWRERLGLGAFFARHPRYVLCGEAVGDTPFGLHHEPGLGAGLHFFVFDVVDDRGARLSVPERYALVDAYGLPSVPRLGSYSADRVDAVKALLLELNARHREGVIMKALGGRRMIKMVTPESDFADIRIELPLAFDVGPCFVTNRLLRAVLFVRELGLDEALYAQKLGATFFDGYAPLEAYDRSTQRCVVYVARRATWEALYAQLRAHVPTELESIEPAEVDGRSLLKVAFRRLFRKSTHRYHRVVSGYPHED